MNVQPSPASQWWRHLYVHGRASQINHQPGPANKPSGQRGFLLACPSPPASKPSERPLGAAGDEALHFRSGCSHEHGSRSLPKVSLPVCLGPARLSPSPEKHALPHRSRQHIWRFSSKTCWAGCIQAITQAAGSPSISPSLDIADLQLLLLWMPHAELPSLTSLQRSPHSSLLQSLF